MKEKPAQFNAWVLNTQLVNVILPNDVSTLPIPYSCSVYTHICTYTHNACRCLLSPCLRCANGTSSRAPPPLPPRCPRALPNARAAAATTAGSPTSTACCSRYRPPSSSPCPPLTRALTTSSSSSSSSSSFSSSSSSSRRRTYPSWTLGCRFYSTRLFTSSASRSYAAGAVHMCSSIRIIAFTLNPFFFIARTLNPFHSQSPMPSSAYGARC